MHTRTLFHFGIALLGAAVARAAEPREPLATSATVRVLHDTNLYLQNDAPVATGATTAALPAREAATAVQATLALREAWRSGDAWSLETGYTAEASRYLDHAAENHLDHALTLGATARRGAWSADFKGHYLYVDGSREAPSYTCLGGAPAIGGEPVRSRREQETSRATARVTRQAGPGFVRGVAAWLAQDFHTVQRATSGYVNYTDRAEWSLGADAGGRVTGGLAVFLGVRCGAQRQANVLGVSHNYSNSLVRALVGAEGSLGRTLKLSLTAGPDWRHYGEAVRAGFLRQRQTSFVDATLTWTPTKNETFTAVAKHQLWLGSGGRGAYADSVFELGWKHKLAAEWSLAATANFHEGDSRPYNPALRRDRIYTLNFALSRRIGPAWRADFEVLHDWAASMVVNTPAREYNRWIPAVGATRSW